MRAHAVADSPCSASRRGGWCLVAALALLGSAGCSETTTEQLEGPVSVSVAPHTLSLYVDDVATLTAQAFDAKGQRIDATFIWSSAKPAVAAVGSAGVVTAIGTGSTTVTARAGAAMATIPITVQAQLPAVEILISPGDMVLTAGSVDRFTARAVNGLGRTVSVPIEWSSANPAIATVGKSDGVVTGIAGRQHNSDGGGRLSQRRRERDCRSTELCGAVGYRSVGKHRVHQWRLVRRASNGNA